MNFQNFYIKLLSIITPLFVIHLLIIKWMNFNMLGNKIIESYLINITTAVILYYIIDKHKAKFKDNVGFIFMLSSFFKFGLFFIFINSSYKADGITTRLEFLTFFIPYSICLIIETHALIKLLNKLDYKK